MHGLAQTCTDLQTLAKTYMTIGKTDTVIFDVEMVGVGLWVKLIGFFWGKGRQQQQHQQQPQHNKTQEACACAAQD